MLEVDGARRLGNETFFSAPQIKSNPLGSSRVNNPFEFLPDEIPNAIKALARPLTGPDDGQLAWSHLGAREVLRSLARSRVGITRGEVYRGGVQPFPLDDWECHRVRQRSDSCASFTHSPSSPSQRLSSRRAGRLRPSIVPAASCSFSRDPPTFTGAGSSPRSTRSRALVTTTVRPRPSSRSGTSRSTWSRRTTGSASASRT